MSPRGLDKGRNWHRKYPAGTPWFQSTPLNYLWTPLPAHNIATLYFYCTSLQSIVFIISTTKHSAKPFTKIYCTVDLTYVTLLPIALFCILQIALYCTESVVPHISTLLSMWGQYSIKLQMNWCSLYSTASNTWKMSQASQACLQKIFKSGVHCLPWTYAVLL